MDGAVVETESTSSNGKPFTVTVPGWGVDPVGMQGVLNNARPGEFPEVPQGGAVWVFGIK